MKQQVSLKEADMKIKEMPMDDRPREKMLLYGARSLSNSDLLALVIGSGTRAVPATGIARAVLGEMDDGLVSLQEASIEELTRINGVGTVTATKILAAMELGKRLADTPAREKRRFQSSDQVERYFMDRMRFLDREVFNVLLVDAKGGEIACETVSVGDLSSSITHPREVFRGAVRRGAYGVVFAHNHPSGDPTPSAEDISTTRRLSEAGDILGILVMDHIIIGNGRSVSLRAEGIIA